MCCYGKIVSQDNAGRPVSWLVELTDDGTPRLDFNLIAAETRPDVVPVWTIRFPLVAEDGTAFTTGETAKLSLQVMRRTPMRK
jgi:hypothetical protein